MSRLSIRWRLVAWVTGVLLAGMAVIFVVVYERTGSELRSQIDHDVAGDVAQLSQAVKSSDAHSPRTLLADMSAYLRAQPFTGASSLLFIAVPGHGAVSNHPELVNATRPDDGETTAQQAQENSLGGAMTSGAIGLSTRKVADLGHARFLLRQVRAGGLTVRVGAGEPLAVVTRAQHGIAKSFVAAGVLALALALIASYLAGASLSLPLRRMARVAAQVDDGDLDPRMEPGATAASEVHVLAETFNHMLDRLGEAFAAQREFIADASHELRTPLTVIGGQLEVLAAQERPEPEEVRRVERLVAAEIARTSRLVDDMLLLARSERHDFLQVEEFDVEPFVSELWWGASISDERRFELGPIPDVRLAADPDRLAQALRNLIRNAVEHTTAPNGLVRLEVEARPDELIRFVVLDDGPGIPPEQLERVFERFHRTDPARSRGGGGAGLGLAIVQAIAEAHDGSIRAVPTASGGARLELELPGCRPPITSPGGQPRNGSHPRDDRVRRAEGARPAATRQRQPVPQPPADES
ncbi:MAG: ATP-binding protein [Solirubrobacteraceae bacterium]